MVVNFYLYTGRLNELNKVLPTGFTIDCILKQKSNTINFDLILNKTIDNFNYNYCYIPKLNKYYFINNLSIINSTNILLELKIDVLMSYKNILLETKARIKECDNNYNKNYVMAEKNNTFSHKEIVIPTDFINTDNKLVLITQK